MSETDRQKWQTRYREGAYAEREHPSACLVGWLPSIKPPVKKALDLACGAGRNALYLAEQGYHVDAVDISALALQRGQAVAESRGLNRIDWLECDLDETLQSALDAYGLIIMMRYLDTSLIASMANRLVPGGYLIAEVHLQTDQPVAGPSSEEFRAAPDELRDAVQALQVIEYFEGVTQDPDGSDVALARVLAKSR